MSASETHTGAGGGGTGVGVIITATATSNRDDNSSSIPAIQIPPPPPPQPQPQPQPLTIPNLSFPYPTDALNLYKPPPSASVGIVPNHFSLNSGSTLKRKRGRPRKYAPDGSIVTPLVQHPPPPPHPTPSLPVTITSPLAGNYSPSAQQQQQPPSVSAPPPSETQSLPSSSTKKARAKPPSSAKNQQVQPLGSAAIGIAAHVIIVKPGEDVSAKIISFSQNSNKAICILSANGAISNVTLCQVATSGGTATYEGLFNILSLSGSFWLAELGNLRSRTGGLSVILAGPDGRVLGGCVAGLLIAASPVQIIVGRFMADGPEEAKKVNNMEFLHASLKVNPGGASEARSLSSHMTLGES